MTLESAVGVLVAVAVPVWLAVEQLLKWEILHARGSQAEPAIGAADQRPAAVDHPRPVNIPTGSALRKKAA